MAGGAGAEQSIATVAVNVAASVLATLALLSRRRIAAMRERMLRSGVQPDALTVALAEEGRREKVYQRLAKERVDAGIKLALASPDSSVRAAGTETVLRREQRFAQMRARAAAERVLAGAHEAELRETSPKGAFWNLGARTTHTADCLAMAGHFWPWSVLDEVHPLLHTGCGCYLSSLGSAIAGGQMTGADIPSDAAAAKRAADVIAHVREEAAEAKKKYGLEEQATREVAIRARLLDLGIIDAAQAACAPLRCDEAVVIATTPPAPEPAAT